MVTSAAVVGDVGVELELPHADAARARVTAKSDSATVERMRDII